MRPTRSEFPVVFAMTTRWNDNDHYGHMNNATYFEYIDTAVNGWLMQATGSDIREGDAIAIVASTGCDFFAELSFPDTVEVGLATERVGTSSITYRLGHLPGRGSRPARTGALRPRVRRCRDPPAGADPEGDPGCRGTATGAHRRLVRPPRHRLTS